MCSQLIVHLLTSISTNRLTKGGEGCAAAEKEVAVAERDQSVAGEESAAASRANNFRDRGRKEEEHGKDARKMCACGITDVVEILIVLRMRRCSPSRSPLPCPRRAPAQDHAVVGLDELRDGGGLGYGVRNGCNMMPDTFERCKIEQA